MLIYFKVVENLDEDCVEKKKVSRRRRREKEDIEKATTCAMCSKKLSSAASLEGKTSHLLILVIGILIVSLEAFL